VGHGATFSVEARYYVRIIARLPPAEPAAAWMRESLDIAYRGVVKVEGWSVVVSPGGAPATES